MPTLPKKTNMFWLFPDNLISGYNYKFLEFQPEFKTNSGKIVPAFIFYGKIKGKEEGSEVEGEIVTTIWNIGNYKDLIEKLGENTDNWSENLFFKISAKDQKLILDPEEVVQ